MYFYETFSTPNSNQKALGLDTLSDVRIKVFMLLLNKTLSTTNPSLTCLVLLLSVVNNF